MPLMRTGRRLLSAVAWLCLTIACISIAMLLLAFLLQRVPAPAFTDVAALGLVAAVLSLIGFVLLRRVQVGRTESPRIRVSAMQWLPLALLMGLTFGALAVGYSLQAHAPRNAGFRRRIAVRNRRVCSLQPGLLAATKYPFLKLFGGNPGQSCRANRVPVDALLANTGTAGGSDLAVRRWETARA
jgi:hypothetical protein